MADGIVLCCFCTEPAAHIKNLHVAGTERDHELAFCEQHWPSAENEDEMTIPLERELGLAPEPSLLGALHRIDVAEVREGDVIIFHVDELFTDEDAVALCDLWNEVTELSNRVVVFAGGVEIEIKRPVPPELAEQEAASAS